MVLIQLLKSVLRLLGIFLIDREYWVYSRKSTNPWVRYCETPPSVHHLEIQQGSTTKFLGVIQKTAMETLLLEPANCKVICLNNTTLYSGEMNFSGD